MSLWNPDAKIPKSLPVNKIKKKANDNSISTFADTIPIAEPFRDAARMAALKRLRHKLVSLCAGDSNSNQRNDHQKQQIPVLTFERWLARGALRRDQALKRARRGGARNGNATTATSSNPIEVIDPIIPSDGVLDDGLVKDLSRSMPYELALSIATAMAADGKAAAEKVGTVTSNTTLGINGTSSSGHNGKGGDKNHHHDHQQQRINTIRRAIKDSVKAVKKAAKIAQKSLKEEGRIQEESKGDINSKDESNGTSPTNLEASLASLGAASDLLGACTRNAQLIAGYGPDVSISGSRRPGIFDVALLGTNGIAKKPYLTVSALHLTKLLQLWTLTQQDTSNSNKGTKDIIHDIDEVEEVETDTTATVSNKSSKDGGRGSKGNKDTKTNQGNNTVTNNPLSSLDALPDRIQFLRSVYCLLARYEALKGAGYQCAIPGVAFDAAATKCGLGTTIECFASPLNCRYRRYCSAFVDVESKFGSYGSFFDDHAFFPLEGSFESNPPFVPETMTAMGEKIEKILNNPSAGSLSFLIVVPAWGAGIAFCDALEASRHMRAMARVPAAEHAYCDGAQHTRPPPPSHHPYHKNNIDEKGGGRARNSSDAELRPSSWDTAVILLQNEAGAAKWPVSTETLESAFCAALREAASSMLASTATIDQWERRGVARGGRSATSTSASSSKNSQYQKPHKRPRLSN
jgi:hypothetical protein